MVYIIAEAGVDHEGQTERAFRLFRAAQYAEASCFKIQYCRKGFRGAHRELPWLPPENILTLKQACEDHGMDFLITPNDQWALDWIINETDLHQIKIGSSGWHLLHPAINSGKEIILSTGGHSYGEVMAYEDKVGAILYCVSEYPCPPEHLQFSDMHEWIDTMENVDVGFSDHTLGTACALAAVGMGAEIIEKHITLERAIKGRNDTFCSLQPHEWPKFVRDIRSIEQALAD